MSGTIRITRACSIQELQPDLRQVIREYFQTHQLGEAETATRLCCETISESSNSKGLAAFLEGNRDTTSRLAILLTREWLIWAHSGDRSRVTVTGARLTLIQVKPFVMNRTKHMVLEISGYMADSKEYMRGNLEIGAEPAAQAFCEEVSRAVKEINPPAKKARPKWLGG